MSTIFLQLDNNQEADMKKLMQEMGYTKKSEFFRFLLNYYRFARVTENLERLLTAMIDKNMTDTRPLSEQMKDLDDEDEPENSHVYNHLPPAFQKSSKAIKQKRPNTAAKSRKRAA